MPDTNTDSSQALQRKIIHIDMDAFFASVEQRDNPEWQGKPVIVGGTPDSRGVVAACSYEARQFGIHSAMPSSRAGRLCPNAIYVKPRFEAYRECSQLMHRVFREYTDLIEPLSLDEAYLDVTHCKLYKGSATLIAKAIKQQIKKELNLVASAGVSYNKFLAKIASDMDKPDGLYVIRPEQADAFISSLPIRKFFGVGKVTEQKMHAHGIHTGADLRKWTEVELTQRFGKSGNYYYRISRGVDERPVKSNRVRKSIGKETTFGKDITDLDEIQRQLVGISKKLADLLDKKSLKAKTLTLKVKYKNFTQITRSVSKECLFQTSKDIEDSLDELIVKTELGFRPCRLLGLSLSNLMGEDGVGVVKEVDGAQQGVTRDFWTN